MATPVNTLMEEAKCYLCLGISQTDAMALALLDRISAATTASIASIQSRIWDTVIMKTADQTVTNNATPQNDTQLVAPILANSVYQWELDLVYSGNDAAADYAGQFAYPDPGASVGNPILNYSVYTTGLVVSLAALSGAAGLLPSPVIAMGTFPTVTITAQLWGLIATGPTAGTFQWKFCNAVAGVGANSTTKAGSTLKLKKLA